MYSSLVSKITYPATPTELTVSATGPQSISASWSTMTGATTYCAATRPHRADLGRRSTPDRRRRTRIQDLQPGTTYYYEVRSGNGSGNSAYSSSVSATTTPTVTITSPTNGQVIASYPITVSGTASDTAGPVSPK